MDAVRLPRPETTGPDYFDLARAIEALASGRPVAFPPFEMVHWGGLTWCLNFERDPIQREIRRGRFYEQEELEALGAYVGPGAHVIDIGANIGNHALYFATRLEAERVVVAEPNPLALAPLVANILVNGMGDVVDISKLGVGLSDVDAGGYRMKRHDRNLGATKMRETGGVLEVRRGDGLFAEETPTLIKIDVEGMEMKVLDGLDALIRRHGPTLLIEVDASNEGAFDTWLADHGYNVVHTDRDSSRNANHIAVRS
ncbi:FkbM family methyltransferase [Roseisalinus antarcticus]|uniref:Methyltransferase FkbM domain-containing protein n=1 Tax=Roseisalinus antarcticus TaxID=254357 RepID=A0A1Y5TQ65_9RHOB|nr:FkbM family methyltransferase [Roseisalinus antarcticus]SLN65570.1 hypothetical protein ROA7023_03082 [Roseisalinus antarcticus]